MTMKEETIYFETEEEAVKEGQHWQVMLWGYDYRYSVSYCPEYEGGMWALNQWWRDSCD